MVNSAMYAFICSYWRVIKDRSIIHGLYHLDYLNKESEDGCSNFCKSCIEQKKRKYTTEENVSERRAAFFP